MYPLMDNSNDRRIEDTRYGSPYLGEAGDECLEHLSGFLPYYMGVGLHTMLLISIGEVHDKPRAELFLGIDGSWAEVLE